MIYDAAWRHDPDVRPHAAFFHLLQKNGAADFFAFGVTFMSVVRLIFSKRN